MIDSASRRRRYAVMGILGVVLAIAMVGAAVVMPLEIWQRLFLVVLALGSLVCAVIFFRGRREE